MTQLTSKSFLEFVAKSGLVDAEKLTALEKQVREKCEGELPPSVKRFAQVFEAQGLLTPWHTEKLLGGKYKGFFLGRYKLLGHIGTGGMSSVYLAEHTGLHHKRAIKVLPKSRVKDASYLARFKLEAQAIASLNHPNIVVAYDIDNEDDVHYIVMEYVDGLDLQQLVKRDGPLDFALAAELIRQAACGLEHAHGKGVIHRDVKPANLLLDQNGVVRLLDMGLALVAVENEASLTVANNENVLGTADYLAPEQALDSHGVDHRADLYGLGCTLYYLLTGKPPFSEGTLAQRIAKHQTEMPKPIRQIRSECPGELEGICVKLMQKDPKFRYPTAGDLAVALEKFLARVPAGQVVNTGHFVKERLGSATGSSSSLKLGSSLRYQGGGSRSGADSSFTHDTVTNKQDDTLASSRSKLIRGEGLSSGDSGRLVDVRPKMDIADGSFLDLQVESGYRGAAASSRIDLERPRGKSAAPSSSLLRRSGSRGGSASDRLPRNATTSVGQAGVMHPADDPRSQRGNFHAPPVKPKVDTMLITALLVALFIVAVAIGFFLARATS